MTPEERLEKAKDGAFKRKAEGRGLISETVNVGG